MSGLLPAAVLQDSCPPPWTSLWQGSSPRGLPPGPRIGKLPPAPAPPGPVPSPLRAAGPPGAGLRPSRSCGGDKGGVRGGGEGAGAPCPLPFVSPPAPLVRPGRLGGASRRLPPPILVLIGCQAEISEKEIRPGSG